MALPGDPFRLVLCGAPPEALGKVALLDVIFQQKRLVGSIVGGRVVINEMFQFCAANNIKPKTQVRCDLWATGSALGWMLFPCHTQLLVLFGGLSCCQCGWHCRL